MSQAFRNKATPTLRSLWQESYYYRPNAGVRTAGMLMAEAKSGPDR
jgi:hypothetical protein